MSNEDFKEQLSALVDDEVRKEERSFLLRRLSQSPEAVEQLGRYFLMRDALRGDIPRRGPLDISARVAVALQSEPSHAATATGMGRRLAKPLAGFAVAASVAAISLNFWSPQPQLPANTTTAAPAKLADAGAGVLAPVAESAAEEGHWHRLDPEVQRRLNRYLVNHSEHTSNGPMGGVLTYVRIAGQQNAE